MIRLLLVTLLLVNMAPAHAVFMSACSNAVKKHLKKKYPAIKGCSFDGEFHDLTSEYTCKFSVGRRVSYQTFRILFKPSWIRCKIDRVLESRKARI